VAGAEVVMGSVLMVGADVRELEGNQIKDSKDQQPRPAAIRRLRLVCG